MLQTKIDVVRIVCAKVARGCGATAPSVVAAPWPLPKARSGRVEVAAARVAPGSPSEESTAVPIDPGTEVAVGSRKGVGTAMRVVGEDTDGPPMVDGEPASAAPIRGWK